MRVPAWRNGPARAPFVEGTNLERPHDSRNEPNAVPPERRRFLGRMIGAGAVVIAALTVVPGLGMLLAPVFAGVSAARRKLIFANNADARSASFIQARYEGEPETDPPLYYRVVDGKPLVISARCTHAGCTVQWRGGQDQFICPCHGGRFDAEGRNISGPPARPLDRLTAQEQGSDVYVEVPSA
jgi:Rieske Fe-S protein